MPVSIDDLPDAELRRFPRPPAPPPDAIEDVYLIGICGTGMGALAGLLKEAGYTVWGADDGVYPPMSTHLAEQGIPVIEGYDADHLDPPPDLTVVGNACRPTHVEATYAREERLVQHSFPEALAHCFLTEARRPLVVTGTHGKTTTTGLLVHLLEQAGIDPGYLIGGVRQNGRGSYALGTGAPFVIEGDEYDSAYFDKKPKFMHYRPYHAVVTSLEFDHADIFDDRADYRQAFQSFVGLVESEGVLALSGDEVPVQAFSDHTDATVKTYGIGQDHDVRATDRTSTADGQHFTLHVGDDSTPAFLPLHGVHNLRNALAAALLASAEGLALSSIAEGLRTFEGMKRRQEVRGCPDDVLIIDDFAHHPTAVEATINAVRAAHPERRLVAVFEPRSNSSRRQIFESDYGEAFDGADHVFLKAPPVRHNDDAETMLDPERVVQTVSDRGTPALTFSTVDALFTPLVDLLEPGDLALLMSNGSFDGLHERLLSALDERSAQH